MKLKQIEWFVHDNKAIAQVAGITLSAYKNEHGKYNARIIVADERPIADHGIATLELAQRHCESLLNTQLHRWFEL